MRSPKEVAAAWRSLSAQGTAAWKPVDVIEQMKARYVSGFDTLEEFERYIEDAIREGY